MDRALDRSRANGSRREDQINNQVHQFRDAVGDLKSRVGNGRDLNRSADEARRVIQEADQLDRVCPVGSHPSGRRSSRSYATSATSTVSDITVSYGRDDDWRRNDRNRDNNNDDWWRRIPFPR